jgi:hypothetical protein
MNERNENSYLFYAILVALLFLAGILRGWWAE